VVKFIIRTLCTNWITYSLITEPEGSTMIISKPADIRNYPTMVLTKQKAKTLEQYWGTSK
jgi:hypothetical protein